MPDQKYFEVTENIMLMTKHKLFRVSAMGAFVRNGRILLVQNANKEPKRWQLPGGHVEENESAQQALIREIKEEIGLEVSNKGIVGMYLRGNDMAIVFFIDAPGDPKIADIEEIDTMDWFDLSNLPAQITIRTEAMINDIRNDNIPNFNWFGTNI